ncbi:type VII secretion protein EccB, partial [Nocardioides sp.]|uniref:type VII secretion protein EccB n=1 Tax=Nocardioides sp. TaxID=35761 RepID=UPI0027361A60
HWPAGVMSQVIGEQCTQLLAEPGELPIAVLVEEPGEQASAAEVEAGEREVTVEPGHGAFVLSGGWHDPAVGEPFVMDAKGFSYALIGTDAVENLGFGDYDAPVVPDSWLHLFEEGEELSVDAALCPPVRPSQGDGQGESCE